MSIHPSSDVPGYIDIPPCIDSLDSINFGKIYGNYEDSIFSLNNKSFKTNIYYSLKYQTKVLKPELFGTKDNKYSYPIIQSVFELNIPVFSSVFIHKDDLTKARNILKQINKDNEQSKLSITKFYKKYVFKYSSPLFNCFYENIPSIFTTNIDDNYVLVFIFTGYITFFKDYESREDSQFITISINELDTDNDVDVPDLPTSDLALSVSNKKHKVQTLTDVPLTDTIIDTTTRKSIRINKTNKTNPLIGGNKYKKSKSKSKKNKSKSKRSKRSKRVKK